jgi:hypothetical protein
MTGQQARLSIITSYHDVLVGDRLGRLVLELGLHRDDMTQSRWSH